PDACTVDGNGVQTCTGNQSAGITPNDPVTVQTIDVRNLTTPVTPVTGTPGVQLNVTAFPAGLPGANGLNAPARTVTTDSSVNIVVNTTVPATNPSFANVLPAAPAIVVSSTGSAGATGTAGSNLGPGGPGGSGGAGGAVSITNGGTAVGSAPGRLFQTR